MPVLSDGMRRRVDALYEALYGYAFGTEYVGELAARIRLREQARVQARVAANWPATRRGLRRVVKHGAAARLVHVEGRPHPVPTAAEKVAARAASGREIVDELLAIPTGRIGAAPDWLRSNPDRQREIARTLDVIFENDLVRLGAGGDGSALTPERWAAIILVRDEATMQKHLVELGVAKRRRKR